MMYYVTDDGVQSTCLPGTEYTPSKEDPLPQFAGIYTYIIGTYFFVTTCFPLYFNINFVY